MTSNTTSGRFELSAEHLAAVNRPRRVIQNFDILLIDPDQYESVDAIVESRFAFIDDSETCTDSVWWNWSEGNAVPYASKRLPTYNVPGYRRLLEEGIDIVGIIQEETHRRGLEGFYSHRINGADNDPQFREEKGSYIDDDENLYRVPFKEEHPDWMIRLPYTRSPGLNFEFEGVREYVLANLTEIAEDFDFDGIELDFARNCPVLPPDRAWARREGLTAFMRSVRAMTLAVEKRRGRPFLLAARVPENLVGCHFDGLDVETWARGQVVDLFVMGCRNFEVDVAAFRRIAADTPIKLYCALDDHHSSDGYCAPPIEVLRGVFSNWYHQGADGVQTFNFKYAPDPGELHWPTHLQAYKELGDPDKIRWLDKVFVVNRRGGAHGPSVIPNPEDWTTPRRNYFNTNMLSQLPAPLANDGRADTLLRLYVGDDVNQAPDRVQEISLHLLLHDPGAAALPEDERLASVLVREHVVPPRVGGPGPMHHWTSPPERGIEKHIEVRVNNCRLGQAREEDSWLVFPVQPDQLAAGENLVGVRVTRRPPGISEGILVEKLELAVSYAR